MKPFTASEWNQQLASAYWSSFDGIGSSDLNADASIGAYRAAVRGLDVKAELLDGLPFGGSWRRAFPALLCARQVRFGRAPNPTC